jgi:RNA polymerase sigma-70 factor (ECF subfamily)
VEPVETQGKAVPAARTDDAALVASLRARDEEVFARLLRQWTPAMMSIARMHVSTRDSAAEVVQDTWLAVISGIDRFEGRSSVRTWVFRILTNIATTRGVRESRSVPWSSLTADEGEGPTVDPSRFRGDGDRYPGHWWEPPPAWPSPERSTLDEEARGLVERTVAELPPRQRAVIVLRDVEGCDAEEVCQLLELTPGNQRVLLHRARAGVRARLEDYYKDRPR